MHTASLKPDWKLKPISKLSNWQKLALKTGGVVTPANILSVSGLALTIWGSAEIYLENWKLGLALIIVGRIFDLLDGIVAEKSKTKSRLGEIVDATCDKIAIFAFVLAAYASLKFSWILLLILIVHHAFAAIYGSFVGRYYVLHPNRIGKTSTFLAWVTICLAILDVFVKNSALNILTNAFIFIYAFFAVAAIRSYLQDLERARALKKKQNEYRE